MEVGTKIDDGVGEGMRASEEEVGIVKLRVKIVILSLVREKHDKKKRQSS